MFISTSNVNTMLVCRKLMLFPDCLSPQHHNTSLLSLCHHQFCTCTFLAAWVQMTSNTPHSKGKTLTFLSFFEPKVIKISSGIEDPYITIR